MRILQTCGFIGTLGLALCAAASTGCFLPLSTAAPQSARTVGKGRVSGTFYSEMPTVDLLATETETGDEYAIAPFPSTTVQLGYGITDNLDVEVSFEGTLYLFIFPTPLGGSIGARYQVLYNENVAIAVAGRVGNTGWGIEDTDNAGQTHSVTATYGAVTAAVQAMPEGVFRPSVAVSFIPASVTNEIKGGTAERFSATAASVTLTAGFGFGKFEIGPFTNLVYFNSPNLAGTASFATGGLMLALRPPKKKRAAPMPMPVPVPEPEYDTPVTPPPAPVHDTPAPASDAPASDAPGLAPAPTVP